jgi:hypothetical protein
MEKGDLFRALGRYNGSLGRAEYPNSVLQAWHGSWLYSIRSAALDSGRSAASSM